MARTCMRLAYVRPETWPLTFACAVCVLGLVGTSVYSCVLPLAHLPSLTASLYTPHTYTPHTLTGRGHT